MTRRPTRSYCPVVELNTDEPAFNLAAQTIIDSGSARSISFDAYPPGIITLNYLLINYVKPTDVHFAAVLPLLRLMTITVWMLAVVVVALIGAQLARPLTGLMAAAIWVANPWVVERVRFALPDAYVTFFTLPYCSGVHAIDRPAPATSSAR